MTTPDDDDQGDPTLESLQDDLARVLSLARSITSTEHVPTGSDEWQRRENRKVLFDEGVDLMVEYFAIIRSW